MNRLSSRERVFKTLEFEVPDRIPLDEPEGRFRSDTWRKLENYYATDDEDDIERILGIDFRRATRGLSEEFKKKSNYFGVPFDGWLISLGGGRFQDEWGIEYSLTSDGLHWRYARHPLRSADDQNAIEFPDLDALGRFDGAKRVVQECKKDYVIEAYLWGTLFEIGWALRGFERFIIDLVRGSSFASKLLDRLLKYRIEEAIRFLELGVDVIQLGDDFGMQRSMIISPAIWRTYFKPRMKTIIHELRKRSRKTIYVFYHSCGFIDPIIPDLIEIGVDILNPIQPEAMDPASIKGKFGDRLVLHGTISIQRTLPFGSKEDVRQEAISRIEKCGKNGGLIIAPAHAPQPDVPVQNLVTLYETVKRYSLSSSSAN